MRGAGDAAAAKLEDHVLPSADRIAETVRKAL